MNTHPRQQPGQSGHSGPETLETLEAGLEVVLGAARDRGYLGASIPIRDQILHAAAFARAVASPPHRAVDLGSGGGLPGLVLAAVWPESSWLLVDAQLKRTDFLSWAVDAMAYADRVVVRHGRAEDVARDPAWRGTASLVTARSFGPPAVVAECATGFLEVHGRLVVSEPPDPDEQRWDRTLAVEGLHALGLEPVRLPPATDATVQLRAFEQQTLTPDRYPRRAGIPAKRPLF